MFMIENKTKRTITLTDGVNHKVIIPGVNQISEEEGKAFKSSIADAVKEGKFVDHTPKAETDVIESLKDYKAEDAIELVHKTVDEDLLVEWLNNETRKGVKEAISKKIKEVKATIEKASDKDEEEF